MEQTYIFQILLQIVLLHKYIFIMLQSNPLSLNLPGKTKPSLWMYVQRRII